MQDEQGPGPDVGGARLERVDDAEWLFCRVLPDRTPPHFRREGSSLEVLAQAFSQPPVASGLYSGQYRLSMDRAHLCGEDAQFTQRGGTSPIWQGIGVVRFRAGELRALPDIADVEPEPVRDDPELPDNLAHAAVCVRFDPSAKKSANRRPFDNVRNELAAMVNRDPSRWAVEPSSSPS